MLSSIALLVILSPMLTLMIFTEPLRNDLLTWMNLFFLTIALSMGISYLLARTHFLRRLTDIHEGRLSLDPRIHSLIFDAIAWSKRHQTTAFAFMIAGLMIIFIPAQLLSFWLAAAGYVSLPYQLIPLILAMFLFLLCGSLLDLIYKSISRPRQASVADIKRLFIEIYPEKEVTKEKIERAAKIWTIEPKETSRKVALVLLAIQIALLEIAGYRIGGPKVSGVAVTLMVLLTVPVFLLLFFGKKKTMLEQMVEETSK